VVGLGAKVYRIEINIMPNFTFPESPRFSRSCIQYTVKKSKLLFEKMTYMYIYDGKSKNKI
jgi:hypothetical protein